MTPPLQIGVALPAGRQDAARPRSVADALPASRAMSWRGNASGVDESKEDRRSVDKESLAWCRPCCRRLSHWEALSPCGAAGSRPPQVCPPAAKTLPAKIGCRCAAGFMRPVNATAKMILSLTRSREDHRPLRSTRALADNQCDRAAGQNPTHEISGEIFRMRFAVSFRS